ncbi:MAG TPA: DUF1003 domain-containing protein [Opitutaceae bacterium]|nr:DUF1003 domain-containing protein [Opitutaceae bacterium]
MNPSITPQPSVTFPEPYQHDHPPVRDVNRIFTEQMTLAQRSADTLASVMGSWKFIILQSAILAGWVVLNIAAWANHWDPYPFILMNLALSLQAAYAAPIIMMSQNRQADRDRLEAHNDYELNKKTEVEIRAVLNHLAAQDRALAEIHSALGELNHRRP